MMILQSIKERTKREKNPKPEHYTGYENRIKFGRTGFTLTWRCYMWFIGGFL
jgi:hypothetical protein